MFSPSEPPVPFYADLHIHSRYSRATSRDCDLEHLAWWARRKGISVVATGDFTHPAWFDELRAKLVPAEPGLFRLRPEIEREVASRLPATCQGAVRFLLEVEISTIYKQGERTRKVHHLIYAASFETAARLRQRLGQIGNLASDGRPILGLDSRTLLEITLESGPDAYLVPAHVWTPWFSALGSKSGFDAIEECYGDLSSHIFAAETGLSSDPPMNWRVSKLDRFTLVSNSDAHSPPRLGREACAFDTELDYFAMRRALETGEGFAGTVEFFPEEGKYHLDGHRACGVRWEPEETRRHDGRCPACGKPVTVGVMHRVLELADRPEGADRARTSPFRCLVPLPEILAEIHGVSPKSKAVEQSATNLVKRLGPELDILESLPLEEVSREPLLHEALSRLRAGQVLRDSGYDGEYGVIRLFAPGEIAARATVAPLFSGNLPSARPAGRPSREAVPRLPRLPLETTTPVTVYASLLDDLDPEQRAAAELREGPLLILAGPGTGKTRTLTYRVAHLIESGIPPESCLALTFSRRAAGELAERLEALLPRQAGQVRVETFHSLGLSILREQRGALDLPAGFRVAGEDESVAVVGEAFGLGSEKAARLAGEISRARRNGSVPAGQESVYEEALHTRRLVDFDDLLLRPVRLLSTRPDLAEAYRRRFSWISIDEYQDVDALQYRLVRLLAPADGNVCAIGDPDQSIYGFRGAEVGFFLRFQEDYPGARVVYLTRNYRSTRTIVEAAVQAIQPATLVPARRLRAVRSDASERIVVHDAASDRAEAEHVAASIERLLGGTSYFSLDSGRVGTGDGHPLSFADFAVLYRTDAQADPLVEALSRAGIPFQKRTHRPLAEQPGVKALLAKLTSGNGTVETVLGRAALAAIDEAPEQKTALLSAVELLRPLANAHADNLDGFLSAVPLDTEVDLWDPRAERVSLLTLHAAKGLEFPVVFLVGCEQGLLPLAWASSEADLAEERRLFFVGITRARSRLFLSSARGGPSPFLADISPALLARERMDRPRASQLRLFR